MNLRQLEAFMAAYRAGSITAAAELLRLSQPSVSRLVSGLENSIGFPLFQRGRRRLSPTLEARRFHAAVEGMFLGLDRLEELADAIRETAGKVVTFGVAPPLAATIAPSAARKLLDLWPGIRLSVFEDGGFGVLNAVQLQHFDLGVIDRTPPFDDVEILFETPVPFVCLVPEGHEFARQSGALDLKELIHREASIITPCTYQELLHSSFEVPLGGSRRHVGLTAGNTALAASLARETGALAVVDLFTAETAVKSGGMMCRRLAGLKTCRFAIVTRGSDALGLEAFKMARILEAEITTRLQMFEAETFPDLPFPPKKTLEQ